MQKVSSALLLFGYMSISMAVGMGISLALSGSATIHFYQKVFMQGVGHTFNFLVPALIFWYFSENKTLGDFSKRPLRSVSSLWIVLVIMVALIPFNEVIIRFNQGIRFPDFLAEIESWLRDKENEKGVLAQQLLQVGTFPELFCALAIFGIAGPIGEEVFFRGVLQNKFEEWGLRPVKSIWAAALLFSLIHFQFYGFFPRLLIGALFGFLYIWSGNIWVPALAHIINNSLFVTTAFIFYNHPGSKAAFENFTTGPLWPLISLTISTFLLVLFRKRNWQCPQN